MVSLHGNFPFNGKSVSPQRLTRRAIKTSQRTFCGTLCKMSWIRKRKDYRFFNMFCHFLNINRSQMNTRWALNSYRFGEVFFWCDSDIQNQQVRYQNNHQIVGRRLHVFLSCKLIGIESYDHKPEERDFRNSIFLADTYEVLMKEKFPGTWSNFQFQRLKML